MEKPMLYIIIFLVFVIFGLIVFAVLKGWIVVGVGVIDFFCWTWCSMSYNIGALEGVPSGYCYC